MNASKLIHATIITISLQACSDKEVESMPFLCADYPTDTTAVAVSIDEMIDSVCNYPVTLHGTPTRHAISDKYIAIVTSGGYEAYLMSRDKPYRQNDLNLQSDSRITDILIDEEHNCLFTAHSGGRIDRYNLPAGIHSGFVLLDMAVPFLIANSDGSITAFKLPIGNFRELYCCANIRFDNNGISDIRYTGRSSLTAWTDEHGTINALPYTSRDCRHHTFGSTNCDTLFRYEPATNSIEPRFHLIKKVQRHIPYMQIVELPAAFLTSTGNGLIRTDKNTLLSEYIKIKDPRTGSSVNTYNFIDGYYLSYRHANDTIDESHVMDTQPDMILSIAKLK